MKAILITPAQFRTGMIGTQWAGFEILVKESNPYFKWYKRAAELGFYKVVAEFESSAKRLG